MPHVNFMAELFETHPLARRLRRRFHRRLVSASLIGWAALTAALAHLSLLLSGVAFIALFFLMSVVNVAARGATVLGDSRLDERLRALRDRAHRHAFLAAVLIAFAGGMYFGRTDGTQGVEDWGLGVQLGTIALVVLGMPALALAWQMPDEPDVHD